MSIFEKIERQYNWKLKTPPTRLSGGYMHKMYKLETEQGTYALKLLNPFVMQRKTAMKNFAQAEQLEFLLEQRNIPILPAINLDGRKMQEIDGEYFYLFEYYTGKALKYKEITEYHSTEIGKALARIHGIDRSLKSDNIHEMAIDWDFYLTQLEKANKELFALLMEHYKIILDSQNNGNHARKYLPGISAICHNDMDCKNVLWNGEDYRIIDLECLSYNNPFMELFEMALCWSGYEECQIDFHLFKSVLRGYVAADGELPVDWEILYDCNNGRLKWLAYNLKRALGIDCSEEEQVIGIEQAKETITHITYYAKIKDQILKNCI